MAVGGWTGRAGLAALVWLSCASLELGCHRPAPAPDVAVSVRLAPDPPRVGHEQVTVHLSDRSQRPISSASVKVEGDMNHPGMVPAIAAAAERIPGVYVADLTLGMPGEWFLTADVRLADGRRFERVVPLPAVAAPERSR
jgi:hypothetical protein